jgi:hypothetical protein
MLMELGGSDVYLEDKRAYGIHCSKLVMTSPDMQIISIGAASRF